MKAAWHDQNAYSAWCEQFDSTCSHARCSVTELCSVSMCRETSIWHPLSECQAQHVSLYASGQLLAPARVGRGSAPWQLSSACASKLRVSVWRVAACTEAQCHSPLLSLPRICPLWTRVVSLGAMPRCGNMDAMLRRGQQWYDHVSEVCAIFGVRRVSQAPTDTLSLRIESASAKPRHHWDGDQVAGL